jgi:hypothetical protein
MDRFCAIAPGVPFLLQGANHADLGPSTIPFGIFGRRARADDGSGDGRAQP